MLGTFQAVGAWAMGVALGVLVFVFGFLLLGRLFGLSEFGDEEDEDDMARAVQLRQDIAAQFKADPGNIIVASWHMRFLVTPKEEWPVVAEEFMAWTKEVVSHMKDLMTNMATNMGQPGFHVPEPHEFLRNDEED